MKIGILVLSVLLTAVVSGSAAWLTLGREAVTRSEMAGYVTERFSAQEAPLEALRRSVSSLDLLIRRLEEAHRALLLEHRVFAARIEELLKRRE